MGSICGSGNDVWVKNSFGHISNGLIQEIFNDYIPAFMQVFLDDFVVYSRKTTHFEHLRLCLERCRPGQLRLNLTKCAFEVTTDSLLGHIVSEEGIVVDPDKIKAIMEAPTPTNAKALSQFFKSNKMA